jgi:hypothetical protein
MQQEIEMRDWNLQLEWKPQDAWIGAFWRRDGNCLDLWVCVLPCLPLHFSCWGARWGMPSLDPDDA